MLPLRCRWTHLERVARASATIVRQANSAIVAGYEAEVEADHTRSGGHQVLAQCLFQYENPRDSLPLCAQTWPPPDWPATLGVLQ
jgi:hypothetical protein